MTAAPLSQDIEKPETAAPTATLADVVAALDRLSAATLAAPRILRGSTKSDVADAFDEALSIVQEF